MAALQSLEVFSPCVVPWKSLDVFHRELWLYSGGNVSSSGSEVSFLVQDTSLEVPSQSVLSCDQRGSSRAPVCEAAARSTLPSLFPRCLQSDPEGSNMWLLEHFLKTERM